jgi:hypothetical protein
VTVAHERLWGCEGHETIPEIGVEIELQRSWSRMFIFDSNSISNSINSPGAIQLESIVLLMLLLFNKHG